MSALILSCSRSYNIKGIKLADLMAWGRYKFKWHNKEAIHSTQESFGLGHTECGQNNVNTKKLNRNCLCWLHWKNLSWQHQMLLCLFTFCSACVSALVIVLSDSLWERIGNWETCSVLKEERRTDHWCAFSWSVCGKSCHIIRYIESSSF
jgi:hypothetical protein